MRLILAQSANGVIAAGPDDDMKWTGRTDKAVFRLLTLTDGGVCAVGSMSRRFLPPTLHGRKLITLSRAGYTLHDLNRQHPNAWLLGGPTIAAEAAHHGFIDEAYICTVLVTLDASAPGVVRLTENITSLLNLIETVTIADVAVSIYRRKN